MVCPEFLPTSTAMDLVVNRIELPLFGRWMKTRVDLLECLQLLPMILHALLLGLKAKTQE